MLQPCIDLRKEAAVFHSLQRRPRTETNGISVYNLQKRTILIVKFFVISA
jgi:hypothetical protein